MRYYLTEIPLPVEKRGKVHHQKLEIVNVLNQFAGASEQQIIEIIDGCPERKGRMATTQPVRKCMGHLKELLMNGSVRFELKTADSKEVEMPPKKTAAVAAVAPAAPAAPVAPVAPAPKKKAAPKKKVTTVAATEMPVVQITVKKKEIGGTTYYLGPEDKVFDMKFKYVGRYDKEADEVNRDILDSD